MYPCNVLQELRPPLEKLPDDRKHIDPTLAATRRLLKIPEITPCYLTTDLENVRELVPLPLILTLKTVACKPTGRLEP